MNKENDKFDIFKGKNIKIMSCSDCNTRCEHCYISYKGNFTANQLGDVITNLNHDYNLRINGTEPLLHPEFLPYFNMINQKTVLTNGLVFKDNLDYLDMIKEYGIENISISYHFDLHDIVSRVDKEYLEDLFKQIVNRGLNVFIMTTLSNLNYLHIEKYCEFCVKNQIKRIRFTNFILQGNAKTLGIDNILSQEKINLVLDKIKELREKYDEKELKIQRCGSFGNHDESNFYCPAVSDSIILTPDLNVYPCIFLAEPGNEIGFYKDGRIFVKKTNYDNKLCYAKKLLNKIN